ncbi:MAG: hypothetical protein WDN00_07055 [Limisphaerales bacterium]
MNTQIIAETARKTLAGTISFPEVVGQLLAAGVEYYHVDYVGLRTTSYSADGSVAVMPIPFENLPPVTRNFPPGTCVRTFSTASGMDRSSATSRAER